MPAREIAGRLAGQWGLRKLQRLARHPERLLLEVADYQDSVLIGCQRLVPGASAAELQALADRYPDGARQLAVTTKLLAESMVTGDYALLGRPVSIGPSFDWHADPVTGFAWDQGFFTGVSYHQIPEQVDFKHIWELGRHQYVVDLSRSWLQERNEEHLDLARQVLIDWIGKNPFCHGIHWTSGLEVAMRTISWIWTIANVRSSFQHGDLQQGEWGAVLVGQLSLHGHYLENHLSTYSSPYNHVIGEATALYLLGTVFHGTPAGQRWQVKGRQLLQAFGPRQFYEDGFCVEQAVGYHYYTLGFLVLALLAGRAAEDSCLKLDDLVASGFRAGLALRQPDGRWPAIGDVDSASSIPVARADFWDFSSLHQLAAVALDDPSLNCDGTSISGETFWLLGVEGVDRSQAMQRITSDRGVTVLPQAGYFIARGGDDWLLLDAGPISAGLHSDSTPSVAHGHADTLQLLAHWGGKTVLRDAGMPNYAGNPRRMNHFRSPAAHNTVSFDNAALVRPAGRLAWSHDLASPRLSWADGADCWRACGEVRWESCRITRHVLAIPGEAIWIADSLVTAGRQVARWSWQLASGPWTLTRLSDQDVALSNGLLQIRSVSGSPDFVSELMEPDQDNCQAWYSPGYGRLAPGQALRYQLPVNDTALVLTVLGTPMRRIGFDNGSDELWLSPDIGAELAPPGSRSTMELSYDSLGSGTWRVG